MATDPGTIEFLLDQLDRRRGAYSTKRMFGEYCLYRDALPVALVCDDVLFVKDTPAGREAIASATALQFGPPYPGAKLHLRLAPDLWDDGEWLMRVLDATADALPPPRPRKAARPATPPPAGDGTAKKPAPKKMPRPRTVAGAPKPAR
ncbi:MAG TPA: TfoX/Sxy family protein [Lysobacter sp.]|nr:TfoX/Sxy family protein [Lysobacter sp.]